MTTAAEAPLSYMEAIDLADERHPKWFYEWCEREGSIEELEAKLGVKVTGVIE